MAKSPMKYMLRAWNKELKGPEWGMGNRKHRKACARSWAATIIAQISTSTVCSL